MVGEDRGQCRLDTAGQLPKSSQWHGGEAGHETPPLITQVLAAVSWWKRTILFSKV